ncbi:MAG TPA: thioredoxin domain-containing protein [Gammaproteobacteria bacterium]|nr:thioredoxin domain-containing protein [Gammaproteobacteria bacterium]
MAPTSSSSPRNRLAGETSPYLLQHAGNPVDWYPWGPEALERARREDRPILLSIGYSACHWCHVMAHESFEDEATAAIMNELFVNIKVDREERPDLDRVYQLAHQLLTQRSGGWPLTVFLAPQDLMPFFAGTYFPLEPRYGMPAFRDVLRQVAAFYREHREEIVRQNAAIAGIFARIADGLAPTTDPLDDAPLIEARRELEIAFDSEHGGFGRAPKFPHPVDLAFLLNEPHDRPARRMVLFTLRRMAEGGIHDHLGGGFYRYAVDDLWMIPHFEKMLYDNAQLLPLYAQAWRLTGESFFRRVAGATADWLLRELCAPQGGFYSALDADSEGHEGRYYLWDTSEVRALLGPDDFALFARRYGLDQPPNFEGRWHLYGAVDMATLARDSGLAEAELTARLDAACARLRAARERRIRPARDDKILTAWNALAIRGLAIAARALEDDRLGAAAERAHTFLRSALWRDGRLLASWKDGTARHPAYLDDHAFLLDATLELLQLRWRDDEFAFALTLADTLLDHFEDHERGSFWFTAHDHETLIHRPKTLQDDATPSGNGIAAQALLKLGWLLAEPRYLDAAERALRLAWPMLRQFPVSHGSLLIALRTFLKPPDLVVLRGSTATMQEWQRAMLADPSTTRLVFAIPVEARDLPPGLAAKRAQGDCVAYICRGTTCSQPIGELDGLT